MARIGSGEQHRTFSFRQEIKSLDFTKLLGNVFPPGITRGGNVTFNSYSSGTLSVNVSKFTLLTKLPDTAGFDSDEETLWKIDTKVSAIISTSDETKRILIAKVDGDKWLEDDVKIVLEFVDHVDAKDIIFGVIAQPKHSTTADADALPESADEFDFNGTVGDRLNIKGNKVKNNLIVTPLKGIREHTSSSIWTDASLRSNKLYVSAGTVFFPKLGRVEAGDCVFTVPSSYIPTGNDKGRELLVVLDERANEAADTAGERVESSNEDGVLWITSGDDEDCYVSIIRGPETDIDGFNNSANIDSSIATLTGTAPNNGRIILARIFVGENSSSTSAYHAYKQITYGNIKQEFKSDIDAIASQSNDELRDLIEVDAQEEVENVLSAFGITATSDQTNQLAALLLSLLGKISGGTAGNLLAIGNRTDTGNDAASDSSYEDDDKADEVVVDTGIDKDDVVTADADFAIGDRVLKSAGSNKKVDDTSINPDDIVIADSDFSSDRLLKSAGDNKTVESTDIDPDDILTSTDAFDDNEAVVATGSNRAMKNSGVIVGSTHSDGVMSVGNSATASLKRTVVSHIQVSSNITLVTGLDTLASYLVIGFPVSNTDWTPVAVFLNQNGGSNAIIMHEIDDASHQYRASRSAGTNNVTISKSGDFTSHPRMAVVIIEL